MAEKSKKPAIRFAGFTEAWEQRKLGDMADIIGGGTPSTGVSEYWDGDIDWYAPAEIADQIFVNSSQRKITAEGFAHSSAKMLPEGTVLFTSRAGIGKTAILQRKGCTNQGFQSIVPHKDVLDSYFIFSRTEELKEYGETIGAGSTFVEVSGKQMAEMELMMPPTMDEQRQIGAYFHHLDDLITLHQRKYDKLVNVKKAMLEKMFPKDGADVPEIRFKGFTEAWEQRKLCKITNYRNGKGHEENQSDTGSYELINLNSISIDGGLKTSGKFIEDGTDTLLENDLVMVLSDVGHGDLLGRVAIIPENNRYVLNQRVALLRIMDNTNPYFLFSIINGNQVYFKKEGAGSSQLNISKYSVENFVVDYPQIVEQRKIANYLSNLDNLITLHQRKLEKLKNLKKACLEKMFV